MNKICREHGISQPTFYKCKSKYDDLDVQQLSKMKQLEKVFSQYKNVVAEITLENVVVKDVIAKKLTLSEKRELVFYSVSKHEVSIWNECKFFILNSSVFHYKKKKKQ